MGVLGVAERCELRAIELAAALLEHIDDALARGIRAGGLERLDEGVGVGHPVDVVVRQLALTLAVLGPHVLPQLGPLVVRLFGRREVVGGVGTVEHGRVLDRAFGELRQQLAHELGVPADGRVEPVGVVVEALGRELAEGGVGRHGESDDEVRPGGLQVGHLRHDVGIARGVALDRDDLVVDESPDSGLTVAAHVVVLDEHAHAGVRVVLLDPLGRDLRLDLIVGLPAERPGTVFGLVAPLQGARGDEEIGHLLVVEEVDDGAVRRGPDATDHREDLVLEDELVDDRAGVGRIVGVVPVEVVDLPTVDAAVGVDVVEVRGRSDGDLAVAGCGHAGEGEVPADLDGLLGDPGLCGRAVAGAVGGTSAGAARGDHACGQDEARHGGDESIFTCHRTCAPCVRVRKRRSIWTVSSDDVAITGSGP